MLPILPTTPFVILAAFAFSQSSPRIEAWLLNSRVFGPMIADWRTYGTTAPEIQSHSRGDDGGGLWDEPRLERAPPRPDRPSELHLRGRSLLC